MLNAWAGAKFSGIIEMTVSNSKQSLLLQHICIIKFNLTHVFIINRVVNKVNKKHSAKFPMLKKAKNCGFHMQSTQEPSSHRLQPVHTDYKQFTLTTVHTIIS